MKEADILKIIKSKIGCELIGDDCAFLKDLDIVVSQDSLIEDVHFKRSWCSPYQLGYKSVIVNISDILASGASPAYVTIALSLPQNIDENFISDFYNGACYALNGAKIAGGDITGSVDKIAISVTAIGTVAGRNISSRKNAKEGYIIITNGLHGTSSAGLNELINNGMNNELISAHLEPKLEYDFSVFMSQNVIEPYAMMDTSDGLADALFQIAESSNVTIQVDYQKIKHLNNVSMEQVLFGGEDYKLVAAIPEHYKNIINFDIIGEVTKYDGTRLKISDLCYKSYDELNTFKHFN